MGIIQRAKAFARKHHKGQKYGEGAFIAHPLRVAKILLTYHELHVRDKNLIAAAYLHDVLEATDVTYEELERKFNEDVANLVLEVTKTDYNTFPNLHTRRGAVLKFADRMDNLINCAHWSKEEQKKYILKSKFWFSDEFDKNENS